MANNNIDIHVELGKIESRFGKISMKLDECNLTEIAKGSVLIIDHARALKENDLISPTDYIKIIDKVSTYINDADKKCICKKR